MWWRRTCETTTKKYYWSPDGLWTVWTPAQYVRYDYNAFGLLVRKWTSRTGAPDRHFLWDQGHFALELNGALNARIGEYAYLPGTDRPLAFITNSITGRGVRVLYQDAQGSVMGLVGTDGALLASQKSSDPWGLTSTWSVNLVMPDTMRLRWQGLLGEGPPVNLYYARARWYDPLTKRFLSPDPLGVSAGVNRYLFAGGDPMNSDDPDGLDPCTPDQRDHGYVDTPAADGSAQCVKKVQLHNYVIWGAQSIPPWIWDLLVSCARGVVCGSDIRPMSSGPAMPASFSQQDFPWTTFFVGRLPVLNGCPSGTRAWEAPGWFRGLRANYQGTAKRRAYYGAQLGFQELGVYSMLIVPTTAEGTQRYVGLAQVECADASFAALARRTVFGQ